MEYSISIRTLGTAGEKYEKLIKSIENLKSKPKEVIVVIPKGYNLPNIKATNQRVVYSEKGMLLQRIVGYEEAKTEFVLLLDDDVEFSSDLVDELYKPIKEGKCDISFPIYNDLLLQKGIRRFISAATLSSIPYKRDNENFVKIIESGGFKYNSNLDLSDKYLYSESAPGMCLLCRRKKLMNCSLRKELWIDKTEYALRDDTILVYKSFLNKSKVLGIQDIKINHLDGGSNESNRNLKAAYANGYNQILFWKRFIYSNKTTRLGKVKAYLAIKYWSFTNKCYLTLRLMLNRDLELYNYSMKGIKDGFKYINSDGELWQV